ncbi:uncharacterized protein LOC122426380 [Cervus canadensis]|uniref:uncharacterized protein LOC122426380 n=1 Tax=Cervus canadensis TaxID=1574408 RepID=UPI001C9E31AB|nr:uncharacterized protein LOC122426380 [Cervus canadensis]
MGLRGPGPPSAAATELRAERGRRPASDERRRGAGHARRAAGRRRAARHAGLALARRPRRPTQARLRAAWKTRDGAGRPRSRRAAPRRAVPRVGRGRERGWGQGRRGQAAGARTRLTWPSALQLLSRVHTQAWSEPAACWQLKSRRFHGCSGCETPAVCTTCREPKPEGMKRVSLSHCTDVSQGCPYYVDIKLLDEKMDNAWQVEMGLCPCRTQVREESTTTGPLLDLELYV